MHDDHQDIRPRESLVVTPVTTSPTSTPSPERQSVDDESSNPGEDAGSNDKPEPPKPSIPLRRSVYIVFLVLLYGAAALYAWVIICILTHRPVGGVGYGISQLNDHLLEEPPADELDALFAKSERHLRAARIVQSVVSVLTIPLTSAVCSQAAVVYIQQKRGENRPTLRQSMALADKGWTDIMVWAKLFFSGGWNKYRSSLLLFALFLNLLGFVISPVQQLFLSLKTIKRVGIPVHLTQVTDFTDLSGYSGYDNGWNAAQLRDTLASTVNTKVQTRLWSSSNGTVSNDDITSHAGFSRSSFQSKTQNTLANITTIDDPFWAELPSGTNTGIRRQFAPRINSTATWVNNSAAILSEDCNPMSDAFYLHYEYDDVFQYSIDVCMPGNMSESPWKNQRSRQDISEELYFKMNFSGQYHAMISGLNGNSGVKEGTYSTKLTLDTTRGYFELPNYANGQVPGPLIGEDPYDNKSDAQFFESSRLAARGLDNDTAWATLNATYDVSNVGNKGPLLNIAMALFGEGSFADVQHTALAAYANSGIIYDGCIGVVPFISLLRESDLDSKLSPLDPCLMGSLLSHYTGGSDSDADDAKINAMNSDSNNVTMHATVAAYFGIFSMSSYSPFPERVENAFASAAFLANDVQMSRYSDYPSISISYDMGVDVQIPHISRAGIIFISALLGLYLICLLALALYSAWIPRWTGTLDSFAMLRIGASSVSETIPLLAARHVGRIKSLDETPGWIGNASDGEIGELRLAGERPLKGTRRYRSYSTDHVAQATATATATKNPSEAIKREGYSLVA